MAIANYATYQARLIGTYRKTPFQKNSPQTTATGFVTSTWGVAGFPGAGATPTTAVVPTNSTAGALEWVNDSPGVQRILRVILDWADLFQGCIQIADRLVHHGGLSGTTTGAQTTNLPTPALTRYTSGVGVQLGLEIYTAIGTTSTTVTASYTNTVPTAGQTTVARTIGTASYDQAGRMILLPLAAGDSGVTVVASVTLAASTLTAGNFGVTLYYPILTLPVFGDNPLGFDEEALFGLGTWFPVVPDNACLFMLCSFWTGSSTGVISGSVYSSED